MARVKSISYKDLHTYVSKRQGDNNRRRTPEIRRKVTKYVAVTVSLTSVGNPPVTGFFH